jgi:hypothetical protein
MNRQNTLKKLILFLAFGIAGVVISAMSGCDGSSPGSRMLSGRGGSGSVYAHGEAFHNISEMSTFPDPTGHLAIKFVYKGEPHWCFASGCIRGTEVAGNDLRSGS